MEDGKRERLTTCKDGFNPKVWIALSTSLTSMGCSRAPRRLAGMAYRGAVSVSPSLRRAMICGLVIRPVFNAGEVPVVNI